MLGRKQGELTHLLKALAALPIDEKRHARRGAQRAQARVRGRVRCAPRGAGPGGAAPRQPATSTSPCRAARTLGGTLHPVTVVIDEIVAIFRELGFAVALGPEIENEERNFVALNFPPDHPALDMHDTLYLDMPGASWPPGERLLLRTHTSPVQVRVMRAGPPPYRVVIPGLAYRNDPFDASHAPAFAQIEGLAVDEGISFVDLKATLTHFARRFFRARRQGALPPVVLPVHRAVGRNGCRRARSAAGRAAPPARAPAGWRSSAAAWCTSRCCRIAASIAERYTGFAFGMGPHRIAMVRYGLPDIRLLYGGDMRFLAPVRRAGPMNVSRRWLEAFLRRPLDSRDIAARLAMLGAPVDAIEPVGADLARVRGRRW